MAGILKPILTLALTLLALLSSAPPPLANALTIDGENVTQMVVSGNVCCSPDGGLANGIFASPAAGAKINVVCNGAVIASGVTAADGSFKICVIGSELLGIIAKLLDLKIIVLLPIITCPVLSTVTGTLEGIPVVVGSVVGGVCNVAVNYFTPVIN